MKTKKISIILLLIAFILLPYNLVFADNSDDDLNLNSKSAIIIDTKTGVILYEKDSQRKMYPASTTKILTGILAIENLNLNETIQVKKSALADLPDGYSTCYLVDGEEINVLDLITVFLVHSANDAGFVLANQISGSTQSFAALMNKKAQEIGCKNTHFTNPSGIHDENHYSTAYDLSLIAKYCMQNSTFRQIVSKQSCAIPSTNKSAARKYSNTNELLIPSSKYYLEGCIGIKTGYTSQAQNCLISCCNKNNLEYISVVLGGSTLKNGDNPRFTDSIKLFKYGYSNYSIKTIAKKNDTITSIEIPNATKETKNLDLILEKDINAFVKNTDDNFKYEISLTDKISAPIIEGFKLGTISYSINGITYTENLVAKTSVEKEDYTLLILGISLGIIIILILGVIRKSNKHKKNKH